MHHEHLISLALQEFAQDLSFKLLRQTILCPHCGHRCTCEGYHEETLVYRCHTCEIMLQDILPCEPLFAQDWLQAATLQHYQLDCPYCAAKAHLVGGNQQTGFYFVCQNRCHTAFTRTIRRF